MTFAVEMFNISMEDKGTRNYHQRFVGWPQALARLRHLDRPSGHKRVCIVVCECAYYALYPVGHARGYGIYTVC
jgi:hypothetical protein